MNIDQCKRVTMTHATAVILLACTALMPLSAQTYAAEDRPGMDSRTFSQLSPLYQAIKNRSAEQARVAIDAGVDVNEVDSYSYDTMLLMAIQLERWEIAKLIIASPKVDINKRGINIDGFNNEWERTPLMLAASIGNTEIVELLLKKGADINARGRFNGSPMSLGESPLMLAAANDNLETVRILLAQTKKPDIRFHNAAGFTAFWFAVDNDNLEIVKLLVDAGAKINAPDATGASVLTTTIVHKTLDVFDYLVSKGADINLFDINGMTPLMMSIGNIKRDPKVVLKFIEHLISLKPKLDFETLSGKGGGFSAMHLAALYDSVDAARLLIDGGATINITSLATGGTALHTAASAKALAVAKYLISRGIDKEIVDKSGYTALITAVAVTNPAMVQLLVESGSAVDVKSSVNVMVTPLIMTASNIDPFKHKDCLTIMKYLLANKASVDFQSGNGNTALIAAAASSDHGQALEKATLLVGKGARLELTNDKGETALMLASGTGNEKLVKLLLDKGASVAAKNGAGETAMSYASRSGKKAIIALLESKGAKAEAPVALPMVTVDALIGTWQGFQDGLPQALYTIILNKDGTFDFNSKFTAEALKQFPAGSVNPVIAAQKGTYTFNGDTMIWNITGGAPTSMKWKLEAGTWIIDGKIRLKKTK